MRADDRVVFRMEDGELIAGRIAEVICGGVGGWCAAPWLLTIDLQTHVLLLRGVPDVGWWTLGNRGAELLPAFMRAA